MKYESNTHKEKPTWVGRILQVIKESASPYPEYRDSSVIVLPSDEVETVSQNRILTDQEIADQLTAFTEIQESIRAIPNRDVALRECLDRVVATWDERMAAHNAGIPYVPADPA